MESKELVKAIVNGNLQEVNENKLKGGTIGVGVGLVIGLAYGIFSKARIFPSVIIGGILGGAIGMVYSAIKNKSKT
jgi:hypothetical protein